ncbi:MAG: hypothetical protein ACOYJY_06020 [Acutalibacteraceae bacterium]|jgi:hypothetical protein
MEENRRPQARLWGVLVALALIAGVIGWYAFPVNLPVPTFSVPLESAAAPSLPPLQGDAHDIELDALLNAFRNSVPKTQIMYDGQSLRASGAFVGAGIMEDGVCWAELQGQYGVIRFFFTPGAQWPALETVPAGQTVLITGVCHVDTTLYFADCTDVYVMPAT